MEERNLNQDASNYSSALQAYNNGLMGARYKQSQEENKADRKHDEWSQPLNVISAETVAKPIKGFIKKAGERVVKKGIATGERIVRNRVGQLGDRLGTNLRSVVPKGSLFEDIANKYLPVKPSEDTAVRSGLNKLRAPWGREPLKAPARAVIDPAGEARGILEKESKDWEDLSRGDYSSLGGGGSKFDRVLQDNSVPTSSTTPKPNLSSVEANIKKTTTPQEKKEATEEGGGGEEGDAGLDADLALEAPAEAEAGLNPVADIIALGAGIAGLFGANHSTPIPKIPFQPVNPSIEHGI